MKNSKEELQQSAIPVPRLYLVTTALHGFIFWNLLMQIFPAIWYFPLKYRAISGYELLKLGMIAGLAGFRAPYPELIKLINWAISIFGESLGLVPVGEDPALTKACMLAFGIACAMISMAVSLAHHDLIQRVASGYGFINGFLLTLVSRIWFSSVLPVWWTMDLNWAIVNISFICVLDGVHFLRSHDPDVERKLKQAASSWVAVNWSPIVGIGLGALLFVTHWLCGDVSVLCRWASSPYPNAGPQPVPYGLLVFGALFFGIFFAQCLKSRTLVIWLVFSSALLGLDAFTGWPSFACGLTVAFCIGAMWPWMIGRVQRSGSGFTWLFAGVVYLLLVVAQLWTVAFKFVPHGAMARERGVWVLGGVGALMLLSLLLSRDKSSKEVQDDPSQPSSAVRVLRAVIAILAVFGTFSRCPSCHMAPARAHTDQLTVGLWTLHFGQDLKGWPSLDASAQIIHDIGVDVMGLLKTDTSHPFLGQVDVANYIAEHISRKTQQPYYVDYGPPPNRYSWGAVLLSRFPILHSTHFTLPAPIGENAPAILATVNVSGTPVRVLLAHTSSQDNEFDRGLQGDTIKSILKNASSEPTVLLAVLNAGPDAKIYKKMVKDSNMKDIDSSDQQRWCQYIFYRNLTRLGFARLSSGGLSDTEAQFARFLVPPADFTVPPRDYKNRTHTNGHVPPRIIFSPKYGVYQRTESPDGIKKNKYHMSTPTYFLP